MKNRIFLIIGLLLIVSTVEANESKSTNDKWDYISYNHQRPITFNERGIKFYIYQNGTMDFRKPYANSYYGSNDYYYRNGKRIKKSKRSPRTIRTNRHNENNRLRIGYDRFGRVNRVGNVFINYNYYGKVTHIGSVSMRYQRNRLARVGGLKILKDRYGNTRYIGQVKPYNNYYNTGYYNFSNDYFYDDFVYNYNDDFFYEDDFYNEYEQFQEDDDYFYYRSKSKTTKNLKSGKKESKAKMIKRKKMKVGK